MIQSVNGFQNQVNSTIYFCFIFIYLDVIRPQKLVKDVQTFMNSPSLEQLSISRPTIRCNWGIPVPDDPSQTVHKSI
jgi:hypothetical protein